MKRLIVFLYGVISYIFFLGTFLYAIGFVGNMVVPKSIDSGMTSSLGSALFINALLLGLFAIQHTIMARPGFKRAWTKIIPQAMERSTFVLVTNLIFCLMFWQWRPLPEIVWQVESSAGVMILNILFWAGFGIVLLSTYIIDHFELFGLKQVTNYLLKKDTKPPIFTEKFLYKMVRHPLMLGFLIAFWATPTLTVGHLFFSIMTTGYIFVGIAFEERDLKTYHGESYRDYSSRVPMVIPFLKRSKPAPTAPERTFEGNM
jgi:protein-S-isoprenylcysteine O-methyltransferase Ste14